MLTLLGLCTGSVGNILRVEMKWDIWLSAICHVFPFPPADAVNNPYEQSPRSKMNNHRTICLHQTRAQTYTHTCVHTQAHKTAPVNTRKHQLLTVTTLFLFVIQSNNTPSLSASCSLSISAVMRLRTCGRA